jgi:hypothetical protein
VLAARVVRANVAGDAVVASKTVLDRRAHLLLQLRRGFISYQYIFSYFADRLT